MNHVNAPTPNQQLELRPNQEDESSEQKERKKLPNVTVSINFSEIESENLVEDQQPQVVAAAEAKEPMPPGAEAKVPTPPMNRNSCPVVAS